MIRLWGPWAASTVRPDERRKWNRLMLDNFCVFVKTPSLEGMFQGKSSLAVFDVMSTNERKTTHCLSQYKVGSPGCGVFGSF